jgi:hypothetical protein
MEKPMLPVDRIFDDKTPINSSPGTARNGSHKELVVGKERKMPIGNDLTIAFPFWWARAMIAFSASA